MRRVVVTGLGAVTPLGNDRPSTWESAVAGRSGIDFISTFDTSGFPVRIAAEVRGFDPAAVVGPKEARRLDRNVVLGRRGRDRGGRGRVARGRVRAGPGGRAVRDGDRRPVRDRRAAQHPARARPRPGLAVLHPQRARRRGEWADRDRARAARPELRARVRLRDRLDRDRRGSRGHPPRRGGRGARRRRRGVPPPPDPRRVLRDARPRRRGRVSAARVEAVRPDARGLRHGRGSVRARARGARGGPRPRGARSTPRCSGTAHRTTRTTSRSPTPSRSASSR